LPALPWPLRKLQAVRFWTHTFAAFHTMIPLRPSAPPLPWGPRFWSRLARLHAGPDLVPSTTTVLRFMPRTYTRGVVIKMPAAVSDRPAGAREDLVL